MDALIDGPQDATVVNSSPMSASQTANITKMKCFYINLDSDVLRRWSIESSFKSFAGANWTLERFPAVDSRYVKRKKIPGELRESAKGCFLSHAKLLEKNLNIRENFLILEDDVILAENTSRLIDNIGLANRAFEWDIIFTEVGVPTIAAMSELIFLRQNLMKKQEIKLLNLSKMHFFGATSYVVNESSVAKILSLIMKSPLDFPFDLVLRNSIHCGDIKAFVTFPFLTSTSNLANYSNIQLDHDARTDLIWYTFKKMVWIEGDDFDFRPSIDAIAKGLDDRSKAFGLLWASIIDRSFVAK
jgi:GR25 family glycosyltransferase involved in LPS biosynthesis